MRLVPATSPRNKSQELVASCELTIFATKASRRDQNLVPATSATLVFLVQSPEFTTD